MNQQESQISNTVGQDITSQYNLEPYKYMCNYKIGSYTTRLVSSLLLWLSLFSVTILTVEGLVVVSTSSSSSMRVYVTSVGNRYGGSIWKKGNQLGFVGSNHHWMTPSSPSALLFSPMTSSSSSNNNNQRKTGRRPWDKTSLTVRRADTRATRATNMNMKQGETVKAVPPSTSKPSPSFTSSFFDSVDERMKELQEQKQRRTNTHKFPTSYTDSLSKNKNSVHSVFDILSHSSLSSSHTPRQLQSTTLNIDSDDHADSSNNMAAFFDPSDFDSYREAIQEVLGAKRFRRKKKQEDLDIVTAYLLNNDQVVSVHLPTLLQSSSLSSLSHSSSREQLRITFEKELLAQKCKFMTATNLTSTQHQHLVLALSSLGDICAKRALSQPLRIAWHKIKETGAVPRVNSMNTYLYVVAIAGTSVSGDNFANTYSSRVGIRSNNNNVVASTSKSNVNVNLTGEVATFHDILFQPTEKSITLRIKHMVEQGNAAGAEALLELPIEQRNPEENINVEDSILKLRTYTPILNAYCKEGDCVAAFRLFQKMQESPGVLLEPENHVLLLATLAEQGYFRHDDGDTHTPKPSLEGTTATGLALFDLLAQQMADDVLEITSASVRRLCKAFDTSTNTTPADDVDDSTKEDPLDYLLRALPSLTAMPVNNEPATNDSELILSRVKIDEKTAICPRTRATLRLIMLEEHDKREFHDGLLRLSSEQFQTFVSNSKNFNAKLSAEEGEDYAKISLMKFADWLDSREGKPFTAIVDGANVAYYGQNFEQGKFNYHQIQFLVDALESMGENVLVTVPNKYTKRSFFCNTGQSSQRAVLSIAELEIMNNLIETGRLYQVPARCLDDYYWMLASVSNQTVSGKGKDLTVSPPSQSSGCNEDDEQKQQWPGVRPMLLSNDQMRDHKMELLAPRLFRRWTSSHIVNYNFTAFVDDECVDTEIGFSTPDFFSREIQGNPTKRGTMAWHFPVSDWDANERFCIQLPKDD